MPLSITSNGYLKQKCEEVILGQKRKNRVYVDIIERQFGQTLIRENVEKASSAH